MSDGWKEPIEREKQKVYEQLSKEDKELLRLGKLYQKRRRRTKYVILLVAMVGILGVGTASIGEDRDVFHFMSMIFSGGERTAVDSEDTELIVYEDEIETYEKIEAEYGFRPVKLEYLPENTTFYKAEFSDVMQGINLIYEIENGKSIIYIIRPNFRESSLGAVIEDKKIQEYTMVVEEVEISITEYNIQETNENRWDIFFLYQEVQYLLRVNDMQQTEVENMINNLGF